MKLKTVIKCLFLLFVAPLNGYSSGSDGHESSHSKAQETIEDEFLVDVIGPIIKANCLGCHNSESAGGGHSFELLDEIRSHASLIFDSVSNSRMPKNRPEWRQSVDAKILLFWAKKEDAGNHDH